MLFILNFFMWSNCDSIHHSLRKRQDEWRKAEEERIASIPDPSIPPGHTLMPAKERLKTLEVLRERMYS